MSHYDLPHSYDNTYLPPRGNVLLLSCMDLRLMDNIIHFMNHDNLTNRYDHVIFAGAALGALGAPGAKDHEGNLLKKKAYRHWKKAFFDQLLGAIRLHQVSDVYILEHRNCGAYHKVFHIVKNDFDESPVEQEREKCCHYKYASWLERKISKWFQKKTKTKKLRRKNKIKIDSLGIHKFLMDVRGNVERLSP